MAAPRTSRRAWFAATSACLLVVLPVASAHAATSHQAIAAALGDWNGVVSFSSHQREVIEGVTTTATDTRAYSLRGSNAASMTGSGHLQYAYSDACGAQTSSWSWNAGKASSDAAVQVDDGGVNVSFTNASVFYVFTVTGLTNGPPEEDNAPCLRQRVAQPAETNGAGTAAVSWTHPAHRAFLLRTSGSHTVKSSGINPHVQPGSLASSGVTTVVTWNLVRSGPDRDHDGLADAGDPNPSKADTDGDGYSDGFEVDHGTNPTRGQSHPSGPFWTGAPDNDADGWSDATEITAGTNPVDPANHPSTHPDTSDSTPGTSKPGKPGKPSGPWYSSGPLSISCIPAGPRDDNTGSQLVQAKVVVKLAVNNASQLHLAGKNYASHMRTSARLVLPIGLRLHDPFTTVSYPPATELAESASAAATFTVFTNTVDRLGTTPGGQPFVVEVKLIWDRKVPWSDIVRTFKVRFNPNSGACFKAAPAN